MSLQIHSLHLGINRCYLIKDKSWIMIDGGPPNKSRLFQKILTKLSIRPEEIQLIVLTHGDFDHVGSAKYIKKLTGAKLAIHELDWNEPEAVDFQLSTGCQSLGKHLTVFSGTFTEEFGIAASSQS